MRVLVTGATGFIGWHTAARLAATGHELRALVRSAEKGRKLLAPLGVADDQLVVGDMTDADAVTRALTGADAVVHAAAGVSVTTPGAGDAFDTNVTGASRVLHAACERDLPVLFVSSLIAILDPRAPQITVDSPLVRGTTRYGRSKAASDQLARELQARGARLVIVYPSGVLGPDDPGLSESVRAHRNMLRTTLRSSGGDQFVDVRDLAELHRRLLERGRAGRVIAAGHFFTWDELTALLEEVSGARVSRLSAPGFALRAAGRVADAASRLLGRPLPLTGEGMQIATRWKPVADSPDVAELGIVWRDPRETLGDMLRWLVEAGRLPARAVPRLTAGDG